MNDNKQEAKITISNSTKDRVEACKQYIESIFDFTREIRQVPPRGPAEEGKLGAAHVKNGGAQFHSHRTGTH